EEQTGGRNRDSIIADAMEALIGAIYLDSGLASAENFIKKVMTKIIDLALEGKLFKDYKTQYQEMVQRHSDAKIEYLVIREQGPDHNKIFTVKLLLNGEFVSMGEGRNKKEAEQNAAREAIGIEK
ncbi:MAG: putative dsRNA-binding protein, partial [Peptostreptococcaceae bacterium]|nr:putative dsRNA-binding protein [Peptostreptococcaceae bacterium]